MDRTVIACSAGKTTMASALPNAWGLLATKLLLASEYNEKAALRVQLVRSHLAFLASETRAEVAEARFQKCCEERCIAASEMLQQQQDLEKLFEQLREEQANLAGAR